MFDLMLLLVWRYCHNSQFLVSISILLSAIQSKKIIPQYHMNYNEN